MVMIRFNSMDGEGQEIRAAGGQTLMEAAVAAGVEGIDAICGGGLACATCHVWIDPLWMARVGPSGAEEAELLTEAENVRPESRLSCQIKLSDVLDGLAVTVPGA